ncbi:hypothetical protein N658DRAFT_59565 [Parathielavia hyrcaniae]|uniref:Uncharacterized protein n=1 Tax=Parathielavia hyrcaniae TaxID=113614 RepID=A0AAN6Q453_9PEZI|nr:hypothetical protein N658DRAFT_59565 [Parathielavia hyrcaniae]
MKCPEKSAHSFSNNILDCGIPDRSSPGCFYCVQSKLVSTFRLPSQFSSLPLRFVPHPGHFNCCGRDDGPSGLHTRTVWQDPNKARCAHFCTSGGRARGCFMPRTCEGVENAVCVAIRPAVGAAVGVAGVLAPLLLLWGSRLMTASRLTIPTVLGS